jgi:hypothetical protein
MKAHNEHIYTISVTASGRCVLSNDTSHFGRRMAYNIFSYIYVYMHNNYICTYIIISPVYANNGDIIQTKDVNYKSSLASRTMNCVSATTIVSESTAIVGHAHN